MRFGLLGPLAVVGDSGQQVSMSAPRLRVLLAALLLRANSPVSTEALALAVWDGDLHPAAIQTLRSYVRRLRRALGPQGGALIEARDPGYLIRLEHDAELDVSEFEALCQAAGAALHTTSWSQASDAATRALKLWRGQPLLDVPSGLLRDEIVPRLEELRMQALEDQADADLHLGRHEHLVPQLRELTVQQPLRERFHAQLMLALYRSSRQAEALTSYRAARRALVEELGVEPGPELRRLHERILAGDTGLLAPQDAQDGRVSEPGADALGRRNRPGVGPMNASRHRLSHAANASSVMGIPAQLPAAVPYFTGRGRELRDLLALVDMRQETVVISAIGGMGGVGKTALAVHFAHLFSNRFPDGQLYVNMHGFDPSGQPVPAYDALRIILNGLGIPADRIPHDQQALAALYRTMLVRKQMLVLIDNARDEQQVRPLLPGSPGCMVVVTSRNQLTGLVAVDGAHAFNLVKLTDAEARDLLERRLGADRLGTDAKATARIITRCAGLPLALNIVASRAMARPAAQLGMLTGELTHGASGLATDDPLSDLRAVFSWSYRALDESAARMFRLLSLHPGPDISLAAAASLVGLPSRETHRYLAALTGASMLAEDADARFSFHELLREHAAGKASECENDNTAERLDSTRRVLDHYLNTANRAALLLNSARDAVRLPACSPGAQIGDLTEPRQAIAWFAAERQVLLRAVSWATDNSFNTHCWQLAWSLVDFLDRHGYWRDLASVQQTALAAATRSADIEGQAHTHHYLGLACIRFGSYAAADHHLRSALSLSAQTGNLTIRARCQLSLGRLLASQGRFNDALTHAELSGQLFGSIGHRVGQANALNNAGWYHAHAGDFQHALAACQQALALFRDLGDHGGEARTLDSLGFVHHHTEEHKEAIEMFQGATRLYARSGDRYNQSETLARLGEACLAAGQRSQARVAWEQALAILEDLDHPNAERLLKEKIRGSNLSLWADGPSLPRRYRRHFLTSSFLCSVQLQMQRV
jgi:DNA-binding SARP family transcriptional activator/tetratricopeptide (TPR) repeat protein